MVKNLPTMQENWIQSLGWDDPLEKGKATHFSILAWRNPWTTVHGVARIGHDLVTKPPPPPPPLILKLQYFGLMRRADSLENALILGKFGGKEEWEAEDEKFR